MIKYKKGFTLIELLVYLAIFAVAAGMLTGILATFVRIQSREAASASVSQELSFVQTTLQRLVRESVNIENPAGTASSTLILRMASSTLDPTIISRDANAIYLKQGNNATSTLTSARVRVSEFQAVKYENPGGHAIAQIDLSLTYNSPRIYQQITQNLKTSIGRVTAATFDDNLIPNINNTYSIGVSPYSWKNAAFSGTLTVGGNVGIGTTNPSQKLDVAGTVQMTGFKLPTGASSSYVLTSDSSGIGTWQTMSGGGISYTYYCFTNSTFGTPVCTNAGGAQGYCPSGYTQKLALGSWGIRCANAGSAYGFYPPPGGSCGSSWTSYGSVVGQAYVCSQ